MNRYFIATGAAGTLGCIVGTYVQAKRRSIHEIGYIDHIITGSLLGLVARVCWPFTVPYGTIVYVVEKLARPVDKKY